MGKSNYNARGRETEATCQSGIEQSCERERTINPATAFSVTTPCKDCPFSKAATNMSLHPDRAKEILDAIVLKEDNHFICHKTLDIDNRVCAGAMILQRKYKSPSVMERFGIACGVYDPSTLDMEAPVYDTAEEMIEDHRRKSECERNTTTEA